MKQKISIVFSCLLLLGLSKISFAQTFEEYQQKYNNAKNTFNNQKYSESIPLFDALSVAADGNPFMPYAKYFKAYSLMKLQKYADARFILVKLQTDLPDWAKNNEVKYLLTYAQLLDKPYVEAQTTIKTIKDEQLTENANSMLYHHIAIEKDLELIKNTQSKLKKDPVLATILAYKLNNSKDSSNILLQKYLIQDYKLNPSDFGIKSSQKKEIYTVALLLPFSIQNPKAYLNTPNLNIKDGVQYAIDSLKNKGIAIDLKIYDSDKDAKRIKELLNSEEFKKVDLIIGPVSGTSCQEVAKYANQNKILNFNFSRDENLFTTGSYVYSTRPSYVNTGLQLAQSAKNLFDTSKSVHIYYHKSLDRNDSILAISYKKELERLGMKVGVFKGVEKSMSDFKNSLAGITNENTSHIAVFATGNNLMASSLISVWESTSKTVPIIAPKEWLEIQLINYDQYFRNNFYFIYQDYLLTPNKTLNKIAHKHLITYGVKPTSYNYLAMGFDAMLFCGNQLAYNGTDFQWALKNTSYFDLPLSAGLNLSKTNSNAITPLIKLDEKYNFIWVNSPIK